MHRIDEADDDGAGFVEAIEIAIDATVVLLLPFDVSIRVEFEEQGARCVFLRERTGRYAAPVTRNKIATVRSLNAGQRVLVAAWCAPFIYVVESSLPTDFAVWIEGRDEHTYRIRI